MVMGLYKFSSQFTDYVVSHSSNPSKILQQVSDGLTDIIDKGIIPFQTHIARKTIREFHTNTEMTDPKMLENIPPSTINRMYEALGSLVNNEKLDHNSRKRIEGFMGQWSQLPVPETSSMRKRLPGESRKEPVEVKEWIPPKDNEERMADQIERAREEFRRELSKADMKARANIVYELFTLAGMLEKVPDIKEREAGLTERKYLWARFM
jgi:hypothetical protein